MWNLIVLKFLIIAFLYFYPPTERFGGYSDEPGVRPLSVHPSVRPLTFSCPLNNEYRLEYSADTS